ncbi:MAG: hypothetical protein J6P87_07510, partial [Lachnospiraceae bacterium]|nr:hypothetical protein [Lachnospiraceae bacterium]
YDVEPYSYGGYCDFGKRPDRDLDDNERVGEVVRDLMTAHKLGCKMIRGFGIPGHLYPRVAQMAAFYQIPVCYEIHAPQKPSDPEVQELKKIFEEINSPWVGFVQDFGCFIEKPNPVVFDNYVKMGAKPENLRYIIDNRWSGMSQEEMEDKMREMGGGQPEILAVSTWFGGQSFSPEADIEGFKSIVHLCRYFHGKFYNIGEDCVETTIPYEKILDVIVESGYEGVLMIEYEGRINPEEQIPRHIQMEHRILGELGVLKN